MRVDGTYTMNAPRDKAFDTLLSTEALRHCLPGCEKFEEVGDGRYETQLRAGVAGVRGTFTGTVTLSDVNRPESYRLSVEGSFSGGFVRGSGDITLTEDGQKTRIAYSGEGQVGGPLARMGQRLMMPAARMLANQFFKCMEGQIK